MKKLMLLLTLVIAAGFTNCKGPEKPTNGEITRTISFDANGGTGGPTKATATSGQALPELDKANKPVREGYYFTGYWDESSGGKQYYDSYLSAVAGLLWDKTEDATLFAQWSLIPVTTISFNNNNGTGSMDNRQIQEKTSANLTANTFTRTGYTFAGWAKSPTGLKEYDDQANYTAAEGTNSITLYALWTAKTYAISFVNTGGAGGQTAEVTATFDQPMPPIAAVPAPNSGEMFTGYFDAPSGGKKYYNADKTSASNWDKDADTPLYARFAPSPPAVSANESAVSLVQSTKTQASAMDYSDIKALVTEAVFLAGGLDGIVKYGDVVVIKPNVLTTYYSWGTSGTAIPMTVNGVCTDWRVIQATAELVRDIIGPYNSVTGKGKIMLIEGSCNGNMASQFANIGYTLANLTAVDEIIGLDAEGGAYSPGDGSTLGAYVTQVALSDYKYKTVPEGSYWGSSSYKTYYKGDGKYWVSKKMLEADALISIPVVKNHGNAVVTGSIKNISIGAAPPKIYGISANNIGRNGMVNHDSINLHEWIADYFSCLPADFVVMDGLQGLQNGPGTGNSLSALQSNQKNLRSILASKDPLAIDTVEANLVNWNYATVPYMTYLAAKGQAGGKPNGRTIPLRGNPKDIVVLGNKKVDDLRTNYDGNLPAAGGNKLTSAQLTKPSVTITSAAFSGSTLNLALTLSNGADDNVVKIDVYIDGSYKKSFNANMANVSLDASGLSAGSHNIEARAYTQFMSGATATTTAVK
jgi:uncharacterized repeat protein (TIGR02543 family)